MSINGAAMAEYTSFRLGGPCRTLYLCETPDEARAAVLQRPGSDDPLLWLGEGTNILVSDHGVDADLLRYATPRVDLETEGGRVVVSAASNLDAVARSLAERGVRGINACTGIPGTVGGAIVGNAGAWGRQIGDVVEWVELLDRQGTVTRESGEDCEFSYRHSKLKDGERLVLRACLNVESTDPSELLKEREEILSVRASKHPDWRREPCAGSIFRNLEPTSRAGRRQAAGWFLEQAGMLGRTVGKAEIFPGHANIIVAREGASAEQVAELIEDMAERTRQKFSMNLDREIRFLGCFSRDPGPKPPAYH